MRRFRACHGFFPDEHDAHDCTHREGDHTREGARIVSVQNRLTADEVAALDSGDTVTIESGAEFGRSRYTTGAVVRLGLPHVVAGCLSS
jgi:hypothetical protein